MHRVKINITEKLEELASKRRKYRAAAYRFLYATAAPETGLMDMDCMEPEHISLPRYYKALVKSARMRFGPLAYTVFDHWGLSTNADIATAMSYLLHEGLIQMSPSETPQDFCQLPPLKELLDTPCQATHTQP